MVFAGQDSENRRIRSPNGHFSAQMDGIARLREVFPQPVNGLWCLSGRWRRWRHDARARLLSPTPGIKISDTEFAALNIQPANFHGEWNYTIIPRSLYV